MRKSIIQVSKLQVSKRDSIRFRSAKVVVETLQYIPGFNLGGALSLQGWAGRVDVTAVWCIMFVVYYAVYGLGEREVEPVV